MKYISAFTLAALMQVQAIHMSDNSDPVLPEWVAAKAAEKAAITAKIDEADEARYKAKYETKEAGRTAHQAAIDKSKAEIAALPSPVLDVYPKNKMPIY